MSTIVLTAHQLAKYYSLEKPGAGSLKRTLQQLWQSSSRPAAPSKGIWALQDIGFDIKKGEAVAFLGNNGSGKSTLLRILSRVTLPTKGYLKGRGNMASLLEVGTGFHPELTGRENIFMNGNLLGMTNHDIRLHLDEIISFSGVEAFLDTPVKKYSSGMYVRLAFSVAAHLDPDVLVVDEALAVGDVAFQQKCLAKMRAIAEDRDKTILFVSHDMGAIQSLCSRAFWLEEGRIKAEGSPHQMVKEYLSVAQYQLTRQDFADGQCPGNEWIKLKQIHLGPPDHPLGQPFDAQSPLAFAARCQTFFSQPTLLQVEWLLFTYAGTVVHQAFSEVKSFQNETWEVSYMVPAHLLNNNAYCISLVFRTKGGVVLFQYRHAALFDIRSSKNRDPQNLDWPIQDHGILSAQDPLTIQTL